VELSDKLRERLILAAREWAELNGINEAKARALVEKLLEILRRDSMEDTDRVARP